MDGFQVRYDAIKTSELPDGYKLEISEEVRTCHVCSDDFLIDKRDRTQLKRKYCSYQCKENAKAMLRQMRDRGFKNPDVRDFVANPEKYGSKRTSVLVNKKAQTTTKVNMSAAAEHKKNEMIRSKASAHAAEHNAARAKHEAEIAKLDSAAAKAAREEREAINKAAKALDIVPLSESDILTGKKTYLPEADMNIIRGSITHIVTEQMKLVDKVMLGELKWSSTQANLFKTLLNKVVPDVATQKLGAGTPTSVGDMSLDQLEALVASLQPKPVSEQTS